MARNEVTLTFGGNAKPAKKAFSEVGDASERMRRQVGNASGRLAGGIESSQSRIGKAAKRIGSALKTAAKVGALAIAGIGIAAAKVAKDAIGLASDLEETRAKVGEIFGDQARAIQKFAQTANEALGQTRQQALDASATFGVFGKAAGLTGRDLTKFSTDMVTLSADLASFANTTPEESIEAIGAALRGESEPIRKYGVLLNDATLRARALKLGLVDSVKEALTPQNKALAAQAEILAQTTDAQGDFARTSEGAANQQRILTARTEEMKTQIGQFLLPAWSKFLGFLTQEGIPALQTVGRTVRDEVLPRAQAFGRWITQDAVPAVRRFGDGVRDLASDIRDRLVDTFGGLVDFARSNVVPLLEQFVSVILPQLKSAFSDVRDGLAGLGVEFDDFKPILRIIGVVLLGNMIRTLAIAAAGVAGLVAAFRIGASFFKNVVSPSINGVLVVTRELRDAIAVMARIAIDRVGLMARKIKSFTRGLWNGIRSGLAGAVNWVIGKINSLIDRINAIPGVDISRVPRVSTSRSGGDGRQGLPVRHQGGIVPGSPGQEVPILAMAGERVTPAGRTASGGKIEIGSDGTALGDLLIDVLAGAIRKRGGNVDVVLTGRGR